MHRGDRQPRRSWAGAVFWVALVAASLLSVAFVWLLAAPPATVGAFAMTLYALRVWTAIAWGVVIIAGLRLLRRG